MLGALLAFALDRPAPDVDFDRLLREMRAPDAARRSAAARAIAAVPPDRLPALVARLERPRRANPARWRVALLAIGADLPPQPGRGDTPLPDKGTQSGTASPAPRAETPPAEIDWLTRLVALRSDDAEALGEAIETVALVRAIAATRAPEAVAPLLRLAWSHEGVFRDECGRQIRSMRHAAVSGLIRAQVDSKTYRLRRYALYQLERMGLGDPRAALADADPAARSEILRAYGDVRWDAAVEAVLGDTDAGSRRGREVARRAFRRYVEGRAPREPRRKLKLPGGELTEKKEPLYLTYRQRAEIALRERLLGEASLAPPDGTSVADLARQLFDFYDRRRAQRYDADLARAADEAADGRLDDAVRAYDDVLARDPFAGGAARAARAFFDWAERRWALRDHGGAEAARAFRKAAWLDPSSALARRARARALLLDAAGGGFTEDDEPALRRARELDPELRDATTELGRLRGRRLQRRLARSGAALGATALLALAFAVAWRHAGRSAL